MKPGFSSQHGFRSCSGSEGLSLLTHWAVLRWEDVLNVSPGQRLKLATLLVSSLTGLLAMLRLLP